MRRIYCDYAATTPVDTRVMAAMRPYFATKFGNAGSLHSFGQMASAAVFFAREKIAQALGCSYKEIVFTGSATEANNLALRGVVRVYQRITNKGRMYEFVNSGKIRDSLMRPRIIVSAIEHGSILETARDLEREGAEVVYVPVTSDGIVDVAAIRAALNERTVAVSVQYANNEIGTVQPIQMISKILSDFRNSIRHPMSKDGMSDVGSLMSESGHRLPLFHVDAVQAFQYLPCRVSELGVDLMTLSAHKIYGPKGAGLLYVRSPMSDVGRLKREVGHPTPDIRRLTPLITGGHQEQGLRAGTENTPAIVGFGKAVLIAEQMRERESERVRKLRDYFWQQLQTVVPTAELNGSLEVRLPNNLNIYFPGHTTGDLLIALDVRGVAASPGSACQAHVAEESYVIQSLGGAKDRASSSVRFTFGRDTTKGDLDKVLKIFKNIF